ncbi:MAG: hypothetical protein MHMPM18_004400 [Marteilia pararefringens]
MLLFPHLWSDIRSYARRFTLPLIERFLLLTQLLLVICTASLVVQECDLREAATAATNSSSSSTSSLTIYSQPLTIARQCVTQFSDRNLYNNYVIILIIWRFRVCGKSFKVSGWIKD